MIRAGVDTVTSFDVFPQTGLAGFPQRTRWQIAASWRTPRPTSHGVRTSTMRADKWTIILLDYSVTEHCVVLTG